MAPAMLLKFVLALALPLLSSGRRASPAHYESNLHHVEAFHGMPRLSVLRTSSEDEAKTFLAQWSSAKDFGLFVYLAQSTVGLFQQRVALVGISREDQVLLFDLRPFLLQPPRALPTALAEFLGSSERTFFGMGLLRPVAQLSREYGLHLRAVDLKVHGWMVTEAADGLYHAAEELLGVALWPRPSLRQVGGQGVYAHLQWAVAEHCRKAFGEPKAHWVLTDEELAAAKAMNLRTTRPRMDHTVEQHQHEAHMEQELLRDHAMYLEDHQGRRANTRKTFTKHRQMNGVPTRVMQQQHGA